MALGMDHLLPASILQFTTQSFDRSLVKKHCGVRHSILINVRCTE